MVISGIATSKNHILCLCLIPQEALRLAPWLYSYFGLLKYILFIATISP
jgi:hypothetical protein